MIFCFRNILIIFLGIVLLFSCKNESKRPKEGVLQVVEISDYQYSLEKLREEFIKLKFGMFIHFNMGTYYEIEWVDSGKDPASFNPKKLDAGQWADAAKSAKMKYAVLTTKHHDGFCLWDTETTDYDVASTPLKGRDIIKEYVDEFRKRDIEPHFYFSIWDRTLGIEDTITSQDIVLIKKQLKELLTNFGEIPTLTIDGWGNCGTVWNRADYDEIVGYIKSLQPGIMVTDHYQVQRVFNRDRGGKGYQMDPDSREYITLKEAYEINDFLHFEEPLGDWAWAPEDNTYASHQGPTIQSKWFWKESFPTEELMSVDEIVNGHLKVLGKRNCNLLLNVAPNTNGLLDENVVQRLKEVGKVYTP
ncbi:alpha-L-fucosidase [Joostella atrarenae]|uniref:alpha-L-fucosidase n=1 Tax=Joostella atrarenae TaxID=679257 RepID=A0ABS9J2S1_9FLAO|nr:alpha-L-fucosidase [Joostella atrarenae]MCF8714721.1 alpha-L-fucosidase [Joostella atrarenae]